MNDEKLGLIATEAIYDRLELEALSTIEGIVSQLSAIKSEDFPDRLAYLRAKSDLQIQFLKKRDFIQQIDGERIKRNIPPSSNVRYNKIPPSHELLSELPPPTASPFIPPSVVSPPEVFSPPPPLVVISEAKKMKTTPPPIDISVNEEPDAPVGDGGFEQENEGDNDSSSSDSDSSDSYSSSSDSESEEADEGIVDDKEPLKVYREKGYSSDEEVMNFDPNKLNKRSAKPSTRVTKIRGNGRYRLRNVKRRLTVPVEMLKACLFDGETEHVKRWVESKVFQNKAVMTFGSNQTTKTDEAFQRFLAKAKDNLLKINGTPRFEGFCSLCQSAKTVCQEVYELDPPTATRSKVFGDRFFFGSCCAAKFEVVMDYCDYLSWLEQRANYGNEERLEKALREFHHLDKKFHNLISN